jgi:hypothetical protein
LAKRIPEIIYQRSDQEIGALLRGLFDTDVSVSSRNSSAVLSFTSTIPMLVQQVLELLALLSIAGRLDAQGRTLSITGERNLRLFSERVGSRVEHKQAQIRRAEIGGKAALGCRILAHAAAADGTFSGHYQDRKEAFLRVEESCGDSLWLFCDALRKGKSQDSISKIERLPTPTPMVDIEIDNFVSSDMEPNMVRSMCCRLRWTSRNCSSAATGCSAPPSRPARSAWSPSTAHASATPTAGDEAGLLRGSMC